MSRNNVNAMAERYKAEMMRIYSQSADKTAKKPPVKDKKPDNNKPVTKKETVRAADDICEKEITEDSPRPKFPSPDEILAAEKEGFPTALAVANTNVTPYDSMGQGNYANAENDPIPDEQPLEPVWGEEVPLSEMTGRGYVKAEITTAGGALPVKNASVIIARREKGKNLLVRMLVTDASGITETAALPAPDIVYSETPDPESKPFAEYILSVFADGYYAVPEIILPVFTTVKSIQPISLVPLAEFDTPQSQPSDRRND